MDLQYQSIALAMEDKDDELPVAYIAALTQISRFAPDAFEQKSDVIMTYLIKRVLMVPSPVDPVSYFYLSLLSLHGLITAFPPSFLGG